MLYIVNQHLHVFGLSATAVCALSSFERNGIYLLLDCSKKTRCLWRNTQSKFWKGITLLCVTPQATIFEFYETASRIFFFIESHGLLIFELCV